MERVHIVISGKVQGVFFRSFIKYHAVLLKLKGYVKNTLDGKGEAVFKGSEDSIKKMLKLCKKGPEGSKVININIKKEPFKNEFEDFEVKY